MSKNQSIKNKTDSEGLNFVLSASFHDAKLLNIFEGEKFGKKYISIIVDFKYTSMEFKKNSKYEIKFLNAKYVQKPERLKDMFILEFSYLTKTQTQNVKFLLEYFVGNETRHDNCEIDFTDVEVTSYQAKI